MMRISIHALLSPMVCKYTASHHNCRSVACYIGVQHECHSEASVSMKTFVPHAWCRRLAKGKGWSWGPPPGGPSLQTPQILPRTQLSSRRLTCISSLAHDCMAGIILPERCKLQYHFHVANNMADKAPFPKWTGLAPLLLRSSGGISPAVTVKSCWHRTSSTVAVNHSQQDSTFQFSWQCCTTQAPTWLQTSHVPVETPSLQH